MLYQTLRTTPFVIAGPCVIESEDLVMEICGTLQEIFTTLGVTFIFKASFDKANRTSIDAFRGMGLRKGLEIFRKVKKTFNVPITTDIHQADQAQPLADVVDILQIPAFLCRQTDLLLAAGRTGKIVNIKKAQFLTGTDMIHSARKVATTGNTQIMLTERGTSFGNHDLVVDFRNIVDMQKLSFPVVMDVTHSCQKPGGAGNKSGGNRAYAPYFAKAAAAVGVRGFFFETHPNPNKALSDGPNMIPLKEFKELIQNTLAWVH